MVCLMLNVSNTTYFKLKGEFNGLPPPSDPECKSFLDSPLTCIKSHVNAVEYIEHRRLNDV